MSATAPELMTPGRGRGLLDVFRNRYLLKLLVDKEIQVRYRGTVLGLVWSYLKPAVQFFVYYIAMGIFHFLTACTDACAYPFDKGFNCRAVGCIKLNDIFCNLL